MLKQILSITGKPGLFKMVAHNGRTLIVEELTTGKRFPISPRDRVVALGDIAMYTEGDDKPLGEILDTIYAEEKGGLLDVKEIMSGEGLKSRFAKYIPDFDKDRVHDSDIKKLFSWYDLLVNSGMTKFTEEEETQSEEGKEAPAEEAKEEKAMEE